MWPLHFKLTVRDISLLILNNNLTGNAEMGKNILMEYHEKELSAPVIITGTTLFLMNTY